MRRTLAVLCVLLLGLVSCAGGVSRDPLAAVAAAPQRFDDAGTARFAMTMELSGDELPDGPLNIVASGEGDFSARRLRMTMDMSGVPEGAGEIEMILDGTLMYLRMPFLEGILPEGVGWISADLEELGRETGVELSELAQLGRSDPTTMLDTLRGASEGVEVVEEGVDVRGTATTHFRATIRVATAIDQAPEEARDQVRELFEQAGVPDSYPVDVWIDDDGLPRRLRTSFEATPEGAGTISQSVTTEFFDFGAEVDVSPPPADETVDLSQIGQPGG